MKFVHISDLHIGKSLNGYSLCEDQRYILHQIVEQLRQIQPDALVIAGDIYDKSAPSGEAVTVFSQFLTELSKLQPAIEVLLIAGNHDSMDRLDYVSSLLKKLHLHFACYLPQREEELLQRITLTDSYGEVDFYLLPFLKPGYVRRLFPDKELNNYYMAVEAMLDRERIDYSRRNVLVSHQFFTNGGEKPERCESELPSISSGGLDNIDIRAVEHFDYVALGHIHGRQQVGAPYIRYSGTPLKYSVSEEFHKKCLTVVTLGEKNSPLQLEEIPLVPLRDVRSIKSTFAEIMAMDSSDDYISVTLTDEMEPYRPQEQLKERFPHFLGLRFDNTRTRSRLQSEELQGEIQSPMELFAQFYRERQGSDLDAEQEQYIQSIFEELEEEARQ